MLHDENLQLTIVAQKKEDPSLGILLCTDILILYEI